MSKKGYNFVEYTPYPGSGRKYAGLSLSNGYVLISTAISEHFRVGQRYKILVDPEKGVIGLRESDYVGDNILRDVKTSLALSFSRKIVEKYNLKHGRYLLTDILEDGGIKTYVFTLNSSK